MATRKKCFVAYPSSPPALSETVEQAVSDLHNGQVADVVGWKSTSVNGKFIITEICRAIDSSDVFVCDLTGLNHNVLFELGYAIARNKRICLFLDPSIEGSKTDFDKFRLFTTVGYKTYRNSIEMVNAFYEDRPYEDVENSLLKLVLDPVKQGQRQGSLLYVKSGVETDASIRLSRAIKGIGIPSVADDPKEEPVQSLSWYVSQASTSCAVAVHFLSQQHTGSRIHNAKNSLVSGLSFGFGKSLLMLAHSPYQSPIDYRDLLAVHETAAQCENSALGWLENIKKDYQACVGELQAFTSQVAAQSKLQQLALGDSLAEREIEELPRYFVSTAAYKEAKEARHSIIVGRKGSGKTAILYKLAQDLKSNPENHVCLIKPVAYEIEGVLGMLSQTLPKAEKGFLVESFWKFLVYTELAKSISDELSEMPLHYQRSDDENELIAFVQEHAPIIAQEFSVRLENMVRRLQDVSIEGPAEEQRTKISEMLHGNVIRRLRFLLGRVLGKKRKVIVLVDNLDKAWNRHQDLAMLCNLLFGLLDVSRRIAVDFEKSDHWRRAVNLSLLVFLRSDIFAQILRFVPERDKLSYFRIAWDDPETLANVVEQRLMFFGGVKSPGQVWSQYFCPTVQGMETKKYLIRFILPRPRDLIMLCKFALKKAVNHHHLVIDEQDILEAQWEYSHWALGSLEAENGIQVDVLESLLYEFASAPVVLERPLILKAMQACGIAPDRLEEVTQVLCDLTFLGREIEINRFEYLYNEENRGKYQAMSRKIAELRGGGERFRINDAFHSYLEVANPT